MTTKGWCKCNDKYLNNEKYSKYFNDPAYNYGRKPYTTPLHLAVIEKQDSDLIQRIKIYNSSWIDTPDPEGNIPLHLAVRPEMPGAKCDPKVVKALLNSWTVRQKNNSWRTAIHEAVYYDADIDVLKIVCGKRKTVINMRDLDNHQTALHIAARPGYSPKKIKVLLDAGADGKIVNSVGRTPLAVAVVSGCSEDIIQELLCEAVVNQVDDQHHSPLRLAMEFRDIPIILALLKAGACIYSVGKDRMTPLHVAAIRKDIHNIFLQFSNSNYRFDNGDKDLNTPFLLALSYGADEIVLQSFLSTKSNLLIVNNQLENALHCALKGNCSLDVINMLLLYHPDWIHRQDLSGNIPLHLAWNQAEKVKALIAAGSDPWKKNFKGETPLRMALNKKCDHLVVKEYLIRMDLNSLMDEDDYSPSMQSHLHTAVKSACNFSVIRALIQAGFDVRAQDRRRNIPLHFVQRGFYLVSKELLRGHPTTINVRNADFLIPLALANMKQSEDAKAMLYWTALQDQMSAKRSLDICKNIIKNSELFYSYLEKCVRDIQVMKKAVVTDKISLYDLVLEEYQTMKSFNTPWPVEQELYYKSADKVLDYSNRENVYWEEIRGMQNIIAASKIFGMRLYTNNTPWGKRVTLIDHASRSVYRYLSLGDQLNVALAFLPDLENRMRVDETNNQEMTS